MAAFSLSNPPFFSLLSFSDLSSSKTRDSVSLILQPLLHRRHTDLPPPPLSRCSSNPVLSFSASQFSSPLVSNSRRNFFRPYLAAQDAAAFTRRKEEDEDDGNALENGEDHNMSDFKTLIRVYKEAILDGDQITISKLEARIQSIETEKNELIQKVSDLSTEITSGKQKHIRLQADFDNFRKRSDKERLRLRNNAEGEVIESLLPMIDNFERAKQQIKLETEKEKKINSSYQGIYKQFVEIMRSLNVAAVPTVGKPFDPSRHEAIAREESEDVKEGIIIQEFRRGFLLRDRLLRPAMVKVSSGPGKRKTAVLPTEQPATSASGVDER